MKYKLCVLITLSILLLFCLQLFSQAHDPLRGLYIEKLLMLQPQSAGIGYPRIDLTQTVLGNAAKEDSLLNYCMENHITYLTLDAYKIMRYDPSVDGNQDNFPLAQWLCDFINKARNQFCISQIAATGSSSNYFNNIIQYDTTTHFLTPVMILDSAMKAIILPDTSLNIVERPVSSNDSKAALVEYLKTVLRLLQFNATCQAHFNFLQLDYEFWNHNDDDYAQFANDPQTKWDSVFVPLLLHVNVIKNAYNLLHPTDTIGISLYCRLGQNSYSVDSAHAVFMDGGVGINRKVDRVFSVYYIPDPDFYYNSWGFLEENFWRDSTTNTQTDYHPLLSSEAVSLGGYSDYLGVWFPTRDSTNIFMAERIFYDDWWTYRWAGSAFENEVEPGGFQWFSDLYMSDRLKNPHLFTSNSPICTSGASANIRFNYTGPIEQNIYFYFLITDRNNNVVRRDSGYTNNYSVNITTISLPQNVSLAAAGSPFNATLSLIYDSTCGYTFSQTVEVANNPSLISLGDTAFCDGAWVFLKASQGTQWIWYKDGSPVDTTATPEFKVTSTGNYHCDVTGNGGCDGNTNTIHVQVNTNPTLTITSTCRDSLVELSVSPVISGATYYWNNGDTSISTQANVTGLYTVTAIQDNAHGGCSNQASRAIDVTQMVTPVATISLISGDSAFCRNSFNDTLLFQGSGCYHCYFDWSNETTTTRIYSSQDFNVPAPPSTTTTYILTQTNTSGCTDVSDPFTISVDTACCSGTTSISTVDSSSNHGTGFSSATYAINDAFYIDNHFYINQSRLLMGINGRIIVLPGDTLILDNSDIYGCSGMWEGITLTDSTSHLVMYTRDTIMDARVAIFSDNGASVSIDSAYFNRNNKAIVFKNYSGTLNASIKRSTFTCEDSSQIATTLKDGSYAFCGIQLDSIGKIIIGDTTNAHRNFFRHLYYGIKGNASSMNVRYCNFNNMRRYSPTYISSGRQLWYTWMFDGYGIYSHNPGSHAILTDTLKYCNFTDCGQGITLLNSTNSYIVSNNFDSIRQNAIFIRYPSASKVEIKDNNITHFYNGISISDARVATSVLIKSNTFDTPADLNSSPNDYRAVNWGIKLSNKLPMFTNAVISDNKMLNQRKGVYCINAAGASINNNYISLIGTSYTGKQYGIWVINSDSVHIEQDSIITVSGDTSTIHVRAIRFEASKNCRIRENYILNTGTGVNGLNYCDYTSLICNRIVNCMRGMMYENITLPQQGNVNYPQDNKWHNIALANRCLGTGNPIQWFHRYLQNDPANKFSPGINQIVSSVPNQTGTSPCGDPNDTLPLFISDVANQVIEDSIVFPIYDDENKRFAKEFAFRLLTKDSTLMYRGLPTDSQYQAFFAEMKARNTGKYINIRELIGNENYVQALTELFAIQDSNLIDHNYGIALEYLTSLLEDENYELTGEDSSIMDEITAQLAIEGGEGVYILRAIMDEEFDDNITGVLFRKTADSLSTKNYLNGKVYPNPNNGNFIYEYHLRDTASWKIRISNLFGQVIETGKLLVDKEWLEIKVSLSGIYFVEIMRDEEIVDVKKVIVIL